MGVPNQTWLVLQVCYYSHVSRLRSVDLRLVVRPLPMKYVGFLTLLCSQIMLLLSEDIKLNQGPSTTEMFQQITEQ